MQNGPQHLWRNLLENILRKITSEFMIGFHKLINLNLVSSQFLIIKCMNHVAPSGGGVICTSTMIFITIINTWDVVFMLI